MIRKLRVAIVSHNVVRGDGQGRVLFELARHAQRIGCAVTLVAEQVDAELIEAGVDWLQVKSEISRPNLAKVWRSARQASRVLTARRAQFDIIHANGFVCDCPHEVNTCHMLHTAWRMSASHTARVRTGAYAAYHWLYSFLNARWEMEAYRHSNRTVAVSKLVKEQLEGAGVSAAKIVQIPNGVDLVEFAPGATNREDFGWKTDDCVALFVGDIRSPLKNLDTLLDALSICQEVHLAVVGGTEGSPYPALVRQRGLQSRVQFLGFRRDVSSLMRAADMMVVPSRYESFSLVLLEAMASGLPVITSKAVGAADLVDSECGIVLDSPNDLDSLVAALRYLASDRSRRSEMGKRSRIIAERCSWSRMAERYLELYEEIAAGGRAAV